MVRVSGCGPEGRRFEPGYPPHIFRSVPRPFTCRAADIAEGRRIFYVPAFAFALPFCLLRVFAFFLTLPAFSVSLCAALRVLPCLRSLLHSLRAFCAFRPKPAFFVRLVLFNRGSFAFCALFLFRSFVVLLARILRLCIFFFSLGYLLRFPGAACAPFCGFSAVGTDDAESILSGCGSVGRAGGLGVLPTTSIKKFQTLKEALNTADFSLSFLFEMCYNKATTT